MIVIFFKPSRTRSHFFLPQLTRAGTHGAESFHVSSLSPTGFPEFFSGFAVSVVGCHVFLLVSKCPAQLPQRNWLYRNIIETCRLIVDNRKLYAISIIGFTLFWIWGMVTSHADPALQQKWTNLFQSQLSGTTFPLGFAGQAYATGNILYAALATFIVNFFWGTCFVLSTLSLIPIGTAFIVNALRGQVIGLTLSPVKLFFGQKMVPHLLTIVVELQAYLIAGFVAILLPWALFKPERLGFTKRLDAGKEMAVWQFKVLPLIAIILVVAAIYEAIEIIAMQFMM